MAQGKAAPKLKPKDSKILKDTEVIETREYNVFILDKLNRPISDDKVNFFVRQFKADHFFMKEFPAIVDNNFVILDGQHRFEAVKRLSLPFYFRVSDTLTIDDVTNIQVNAGWSPADYLHSYVQQGKMPYIITHRFVERYEIPVSTAVRILSPQNEDFMIQGSIAAHLK